MLGSIEVFENREIRNYRVLFSICREHRDSIFHKGSYFSCNLLSVYFYISTFIRKNAEHCLHQFACPWACKTCKSQDLSPSYREVYLFKAVTRVVMELKNLISQLSRLIVVCIHVVHTYHVGSKLLSIHVLNISTWYKLSVSKYSVSICNSKYFRHLMRNEDKALSCLFKSVKNTEKMIYFIVGQSCSRLIQNQ